MGISLDKVSRELSAMGAAANLLYASIGERREHVAYVPARAAPDQIVSPGGRKRIRQAAVPVRLRIVMLIRAHRLGHGRFLVRRRRDRCESARPELGTAVTVGASKGTFHCIDRVPIRSSPHISASGIAGY